MAAPPLRHVLSRFSYGVTPNLVAKARELGGAQAWFETQLAHSDVADLTAKRMRGWFPYLAKTARELYVAQTSGEYPAWQSTMDLGRWTILRRTYSKRQLFETMVEFWSNLLHVPLYEDESWPHRIGYDGVIRKHALGRFEDMLAGATVHGAMGCYLDNAISTKWAVNENLGRELLELHTVGVEAGYTEREVLHSAYILTGWRVDMWDSWNSYYAPRDHWTGPVSVLGFTDPNATADGQALTMRYLRFLAHHPATARRIATKLCVRFVADQPSSSIVDAVAAAYLSSGTDIKATLRALQAHPDFAASVDGKVRTPAEDAIAAYRVLGARVEPPTSDDDFARAIGWQLESLGQKPYGWPAPDGFPDVGIAWSSVGRVLSSLDLHLTLAGGWWPSKGVTYPTVAERLPTLPARFDAIVDHTSRQLLQRPATPQLQAACRAMLGLAAGDRFTRPADFGEWRLVQLLATVLNSPAHSAR
ncbi:MAG: DUF1800 domain-containing protein [Nocardioidaceae bacterium]|nr:DUF1800 domain-containing protein [Nocardioidaceae bacterium]